MVQIPVADLGFPRWGALTYYFEKKLHENERNWTERDALGTLDPPI